MVDEPSVLGLARTEVRHTLAHDQWAEVYEVEAQRLREALGDAVVDIQHVGSTGVPGLIAKPILDIIVSMDRLELVAKMEPALEAAGWLRRTAGDTEGRRYFVKGPPEMRTGHLSIVEPGTYDWDSQVRFRDILRARPEVLAKYADLKRDLARRYPNDRKAYTEGKANFIQAVLEDNS